MTHTDILHTLFTLINPVASFNIYNSKYKIQNSNCVLLCLLPSLPLTLTFSLKSKINAFINHLLSQLFLVSLHHFIFFCFLPSLRERGMRAVAVSYPWFRAPSPSRIHGIPRTDGLSVSIMPIGPTAVSQETTGVSMCLKSQEGDTLTRSGHKWAGSVLCKIKSRWFGQNKSEWIWSEL